VDRRKKRKIVVTAALPYANGYLHIGGVASTYLPSDIFARYCRMRGYDVVFTCATDDFGTPILINAESEGLSPEEYVRKWFIEDQKDFEKLGIFFDFFGQTSSKENIKMAQSFFTSLYKKGFIYVREVIQPYCEKCKRFLPDRYLKGTCPYCGAKDQYSDYCEVCGRVIPAGKLKNPHCAICGSKPIYKKSKHYFFKLSAFAEKLMKWLTANEKLQKEVKNYVIQWIKEGLKDWDITRDIPWGVPIPLKEAEGKVLYGWFDNHLCYITVTLLALERRGIATPEKFWNEAEIYHFIGKDIVYHHYLYMPAIRLADGRFKLPDYIPTRGYLTLYGKGMSKSRGWFISLRDFLSSFPADYLRFYLSRITPYSQTDIDFDWDDFLAKINNELVASIGNYIHRVITLINRFHDGIVPSPSNPDHLDENFKDLTLQLPYIVGDFIEKNQLDLALQKILEFSKKCNQYFQTKKPWIRNDASRNCLYFSINAVRTLAIVLAPFIPFSSQKIWHLLNLPGRVHDANWDSTAELKIAPGHKIGEPQVLFKKIDPKKIEEEKSKLKSSSSKEQSSPLKLLKTLRIGRITNVRKIDPKYLHLEITVGNKKYSSVAGLGVYYSAEDLKNKLVVVMIDLPPKRIHGVESNSMILAADTSPPTLIIPEKKVAPGTKIR